MPNKNTTIMYICIAFCLFGYILPWIITPTAPLTLGAYDLAEWTSLHPSQPNTFPALVVPLLLRVHLVVFTVFIALFAETQHTKLISAIAIVLFSLAQLPPLEFLTIATSNINYQQQFILAVISLGFGLWLTFFKPGRFIPIMNVISAVLGVICAVIGLQQAQSLYLQSLQENTIGIGIIFVLIAYLVVGIINLRQIDLKVLLQCEQPMEIKQGSL